MQHKHHAITIARRLARLPKRYYVIMACVLLALWYVLVFGVQQSIKFSYNDAACVPRLTLLPNTHSSSDNKFDIKLRGGVAGLYSTQACVEPIAAPKEGVAYAATAPLGGWLFRQQYRVDVPAHPTVNAANLKKPIAPKKPITIRLNQPDQLFEYTLSANGKTAACKPRVDSAELQCDATKLGLAQGQRYDMTLGRSYNGTSRTTLVRQQVATLTPVEFVQSSVAKDAVVYAKPREFTLASNKPLRHAAAELQRIVDNKPQPVAGVTVKAAGNELRVVTDKDLPRESTYRLVVTQAEAGDGSTLASEYAVPFAISGGPKIARTDARGGDIDPSSRLTLQFDQNLSPSQDIQKLVKVDGVPATFTRQGNRVVVQLQNAPKCANAKISLAKGVESEHGVPATAEWSTSFQVRCYSLETIGYSVNGQPINAYFFGSGARTLLFTGAIHGNERSAGYIMQDWVAALKANPARIPAGTQVVVVPTVNPDGFASGKRFNARDVNLNRNWPTYNWTKDIDVGGGSIVPGGGGSTPLSEPESQALAALTRRLSPSLVATYHSQGSIVNSNDVGMAPSIGQSYANAAGYRYVSNSETLAVFESETITGTYEDWLITQGIPAILMELPGNNGRYFSGNSTAMWSLVTR